MKKVIVITAVSICLFAFAGLAGADPKGKKGAELFKEFCSACHPDGGNVINPKKTLDKKSREANKIKSATDIVNKMRNPGQGMTKFDKNAISDKDAKKIAEYILDAFK
ncbi:MAG: c-type cytochrome [Deltaproteobacteria bacterium]|nr:c-type cytochrome [Deltaproteobacteria bacterium]